MDSTTGNITIHIHTQCKVELDWTIDDFPSYFNGTSNIKSPVFIWSDVSWQLNTRMAPFDSENISTEMRLFLRKVTCDNKQLGVILKFGIRLNDGTTEMRCFLSRNFRDSAPSFGTEQFILQSELVERKHQLMPEGNLTLTFLIAHQHSLTKLLRENYDGLDTLSSNLRTLYGCTETSDITIIVGEQIFLAHKVILIARSDVFAAMFQHDTVEARNGVISVTDCEPNFFEDFLLYLYTGRIENFSWNNVCQLCKIADKYNVQSLKDLCIKYVKENGSPTNFLDIVRANEFDDYDLKSAIQEVFNKNATDILKRDDWEQFLKQNYRKANQILIYFSRISKIKNEGNCIVYTDN